MKIVKKNRRAVSPVVAVILMFVLILAAIGVSLGYMIPRIAQFKQNSNNNTARLYFTSLDSSIRNMVNNPPPISQTFDYYQTDGSIFVDNSWKLFFSLDDTVDQSKSTMILQENVSRLMHKTVNVEDYSPGEHRYLIGPQDQDYLFLNGSGSNQYNDLSVLNETRRTNQQSYLYLALYYRYSLDINYRTSGNVEYYNINLYHIQLMTLNMQSENFSGILHFQLEYNGTSKTTFDPIQFTHNIQGKASLYGDLKTIEEYYPLFIPVNDNYAYHYINFNIIKINMIINIVS